MPLNIGSVNPDPLPGINAIEVPVSGTGSPPGITEGGPQAVAQATSVNPRPISGIQVEIPPMVDAGVRLAKVVLAIAAGSILCLILYLISMELLLGWDIHRSYDQVLNPSRIGSEFYTLGRLEELSLDLGAARKDPTAKWTVDSLKNAEGILKMIDTLPSVITSQKAQLKACIPLPEASPSRNDKLDRCLEVTEAIRQAALEAAAGTTNAQVAADSATKLNEHRQTLHTFWIQAAQLILLNLLLPLLTALFGYIFGTQQAQKNS